jgi:hypothetical protein
VHYKVSYTLQVQQAHVGPPTATESAEQLLASASSAVVETAWKDVATLQDPPAQGQKVGHGVGQLTVCHHSWPQPAKHAPYTSGIEWSLLVHVVLCRYPHCVLVASMQSGCVLRHLQSWTQDLWSSARPTFRACWPSGRCHAHLGRCRHHHWHAGTAHCSRCATSAGHCTSTHCDSRALQMRMGQSAAVHLRCRSAVSTTRAVAQL